MTRSHSDSSVKLSGDALNELSVDYTGGSDSFLRVDGEGSAWSFDPTESVALDVMVSHESGDVMEQFSFNQPFVLIGRSPDCDLTLPDRSISFRHAYLQRMFGRILCVDLASRTGTHWEQGQRPFGWFDEHHPIKVGPYELKLVSHVLDDEPEAPEFDAKTFFRSFSDHSVLPTVSLQHLSRRGPGESWTINRPITLVGASHRCKLRLKHKSVSVVHCSLLLMPDGLWVVDLLGRGGTRVDGDLVRHVRADDGATLQVGRYAFRISYESPPGNKSSTDQTPAPTTIHQGVSEEFVGRLMNQIANMQQQFLQHSQMQSEMLMQFFGTMYTNQHNLLRDEMERLHEINREMRDLKGHLAKSPQENNAASGPEAPRNNDREELDSLQSQFDELRSEFQSHRETASAAGAEDEQKSAEDANWRLQQAAERDREDIEPAEPSDDIEDEIAAKKRQEVPVQEAASPAAEDAEDLPSGDNDEAPNTDGGEQCERVDHHAWVLNRMHVLEQERKGIFRKMMQTLFTSEK